MKRRNLESRVEVEDQAVKARVMAVLWALSGEKTITEICEETGLKQVQYYKLEAQMLKGMILAAESSLQGGRRRNPLTESRDLEERNRRLRQENLRIGSVMRLTRKLFKMPSKGPKKSIRRGRPPKAKTTPTEKTPEAVVNK
jgi:hypothetical protein